MNFSKGPAILGVLTAIVVVVAVLLISGGDDARTPPADDSDQSAQTTPSDAESEPQEQPKDKQEKPEGSGSEAPDEPVVEVENGQPVGGVQELSFAPGDEIRFAVTSDTADEVHFHGYDIEEEVPAGGEVQFSADADLEGVFEVELHSSAVQIAEVTVSP